MLYSKLVTIPAQTLAANPYCSNLDLTEGVITRVWVRWRFGSGNLCGLQLRYASFAYWPLTLGEWFPSTVHPLEFSEHYPLTTAPFSIDIVGYNQDDVYAHTVWVAVLVERPVSVPGLTQLLEYLAVER